MPIIKNSNFRSPFWLLNAHWETVLPGILRKPKPLNYTRERMITSDGDFLDLDFVYGQNEKILILSHGLD